eukprot:SAG31_NODE_1310_length_8870_cov_2.332231_7_plen_100_part_00
MLIVCATVLLGLVEQISGLYTVKSPKAVKFAMIMIVLHVILGYTLLVASRRRIATVANDFWAVIETSLTVFLVTEIDGGMTGLTGFPLTFLLLSIFVSV